MPRAFEKLAGRTKVVPRLRADAPDGRKPQRLFAAFTAAILVGIWATTAWIAIERRKEIYASALSELIGAQSVLRFNIERTYELMRSTLEVSNNWLARYSSDPTKGNIEDLADLVTSMQAFEDDPVALRFVEENGYLFRLGQRNLDNASIYIGDRDYFQTLKALPPGTYSIEPAVTSRDTRNNLLPITTRARPNAFGIGYIIAAIRTSGFKASYQGLLISAPSEIGFVRDDGTILFAWPSEVGLVGRKIPGFTDAIVRRDPNHVTTHVASRLLPSLDRGDQALVAYARLVHEPITVFAAFNDDDLQAKWRATLYPLIGAALAASIVVLFLAWRMLRLMRLNQREATRLGDALVRAEAANVAKKEFLANMSHELRTPLNAVIGFAEVMSMEVMGPLENQIYKGYATEILGAGKHLLGIIKSILDLARIDAGTFDPGSEPISLASCVEQCVGLTDQHATEKGITVEVRIDPDLPALLCDPTHLKQVVLNIVGNAIKFTPKGGQVSIRGVLREALVIEISDTGIGIPQDRIGELFKPFTQVAGSMNRDHEGLGLGLAYSKRILRAYGGHISLASAVGKGTTATITWPRERLLGSGASAPMHAPYGSIPN
jgi:signal transduction histidine kinase